MHKVISIVFLMYCCNLSAEPKTVLVGAGTASCQQFLEFFHDENNEENNITRIKYVSWAQGYVSGRNKQLEHFDYKMKLIPGEDAYWNILVYGCKKAQSQNSEEMQLSAVLDQLFSDVFGKNLTKKQ